MKMKCELYIYLFSFLGMVGGCAGTPWGCCLNGVSIASGPNHEGCDTGR